MTTTVESTTLHHTIAVTQREGQRDPSAEKLTTDIGRFFDGSVTKAKRVQLFHIHKAMDAATAEKVASELFLDPITQQLVDDQQLQGYDWMIEVALKAGMTDNAASVAQTTISDFLHEPFFPEEKVTTATQYWLQGSLTHDQALTIAHELLANRLIHTVKVERVRTHKKHPSLPSVEVVDLSGTDEELQELSRERQLALNLEELHAIRAYYADSKVAETRVKAGLPAEPTDVELEALAQTWSEHCKHKIFNATIRYSEGGKSEVIQGLFKTYIRAATERLSSDFLISVFTDNAGIIDYDENNNLAFKVETHNSPSALDPYGGALTGILGVNRDIMGAGKGARVIANTDVFCFAPPNYNKPLPPRLLHPQRIAEGVRQGVEDGGNKSGIPTINGSITYDDRYLGKPLVYCGSVGILPKKVRGTPTEEKEIVPGDLIVIAGGRTGRDGIHGATFSSEELHAESPSSAVQIGDPFTQKKVHDFLLEARDMDLYRTLTDNGAGGFSSSVGELAELSGGCEIHLDRAPLKQLDLLPWEILVSESQERMTLAVHPDSWAELQQLAMSYEVELSAIGVFTNSNYLHCLYNNETVAFLDLDFLHNGVPTLQLEAEWSPQPQKQIKLPERVDLKDLLHRLLRRFNIRSKESIVRQYDHEVQGGSVIKPLMGRCNDGPSDAAVSQPYESLGSERGYVLSHGLCPRYSDSDCYDMATCAVDEAVRNAVAVGANPLKLAILDNFCWPDPIHHETKNRDGKQKLAQLVRANRGLYDAALAFQAPIISGKDSMKNDYVMDGQKISVPPTLLVSALGVIESITSCVSMDFKVAGDVIYILGVTEASLGCSEYADELQLQGGQAPKVCFERATRTYASLHEAMRKGLVASCHDCSDGGFAVALAESAFAGGLGAEVDVEAMRSTEELNESEYLFGESPSRLIVSVAPEKAAAFEGLIPEELRGRIGAVRNDERLLITRKKEVLIDESIAALKRSWQGGEE